MTMSDTKQKRVSFAEAKSIRAEAAAWVLKQRDTGQWSEADQAALDAWLAQSPQHMVAYLRLDTVWTRADRLAALRNFPPEAVQSRAHFSPLLLRIAAAFAIAALVGVATASYLLSPRERVFSTPVGGHEIVSFADGSRIELNTDTVIRARMTTDSRTVWLEKGEAYFQVKHDAAHPFVVMAGDHRITDLGTKFLVRRDTAKLEVAVMQGRVKFDTPDMRTPLKPALLTPGDVMTATASTVFITHENARAAAKELSWRRGVLIFDSTSLADAASEFNRYNREKLVIADPAVAGMTIDGTFPTDNVRLFARVVQDVLGLRVESRADESVILR
jgi:transmembrane sensor